jgi:hypothetical protein
MVGGVFLGIFFAISYFLALSKISPFSFFSLEFEKLIGLFGVATTALLSSIAAWMRYIKKIQLDLMSCTKKCLFTAIFINALFVGAAFFFDIKPHTSGAKAGNFLLEPSQLVDGRRWGVEIRAIGNIEVEPEIIRLNINQLSGFVVKNQYPDGDAFLTIPKTLPFEVVRITDIEFSICTQSPSGGWNKIDDISNGTNVYLLNKEIKVGEAIEISSKKFEIKLSSPINTSKSWICAFIYNEARTMDRYFDRNTNRQLSEYEKLFGKNARQQFERAIGYYPIRSRKMLNGEPRQYSQGKDLPS